MFSLRVAIPLPRLAGANCRIRGLPWTSRSWKPCGWEQEQRIFWSRCLLAPPPQPGAWLLLSLFPKLPHLPAFSQLLVLALSFLLLSGPWSSPFLTESVVTLNIRFYAGYLCIWRWADNGGSLCFWRWENAGRSPIISFLFVFSAFFETCLFSQLLAPCLV